MEYATTTYAVLNDHQITSIIKASLISDCIQFRISVDVWGCWNFSFCEKASNYDVCGNNVCIPLGIKLFAIWTSMKASCFQLLTSQTSFLNYSNAIYPFGGWHGYTMVET